jgi:hypothetical protein
MNFVVKANKIIVITFILVGIVFLSCNQDKKESSDKRSIEAGGIAEIKFDTTYYNFGDLIQGEKAVYTFKFKNTGTANLMIEDAYSTCGCTVPNYSKEPIAPGEIGRIEVLFDSSGKHGVQYKTVGLKLNTKRKEKSLNIRANVIEE